MPRSSRRIKSEDNDNDDEGKDAENKTKKTPSKKKKSTSTPKKSSSAAATAASETPKKRGRGRPRKVTTTEAQSPSEGKKKREKTTPAATTNKRKRKSSSSTGKTKTTGGDKNNDETTHIIKDEENNDSATSTTKTPQSKKKAKKKHPNDVSDNRTSRIPSDSVELTSHYRSITKSIEKHRDALSDIIEAHQVISRGKFLLAAAKSRRKHVKREIEIAMKQLEDLELQRNCEWNDMYKRLEAYVAEHGHCFLATHQSRRDGDDPGLVQWVGRQRSLLRHFYFGRRGSNSSSGGATNVSESGSADLAKAAAPVRKEEGGDEEKEDSEGTTVSKNVKEEDDDAEGGDEGNDIDKDKDSMELTAEETAKIKRQIEEEEKEEEEDSDDDDDEHNRSNPSAPIKPPTTQSIRYSLLNRLGFCWNANEACWKRHYLELCSFKAERGHPHVSSTERDPRYASLASWVVSQRKAYVVQNRLKSGLAVDGGDVEKANSCGYLPQDRIDLLVGLGFDFQRRPTRWEERYNELVEYKQKYGDCLVPQKFPENQPLGRWTRKQMEHYKRYEEGKPTPLTQERIDLLEKIGFVWQRAPRRPGRKSKKSEGGVVSSGVSSVDDGNGSDDGNVGDDNGDDDEGVGDGDEEVEEEKEEETAMPSFAPLDVPDVEGQVLAASAGGEDNHEYEQQQQHHYEKMQDQQQHHPQQNLYSASMGEAAKFATEMYQHHAAEAAAMAGGNVLSSDVVRMKQEYDDEFDDAEEDSDSGGGGDHGSVPMVQM